MPDPKRYRCGTVPQERKAFRSPKPVQLRSPESGQKICQKKRKNGISVLKDQIQELQDETSDLRLQLFLVTADLRSQLETKDEELEVMAASKMRVHQSLQIALKRALDAEHRLVCQQKDPKEGGQDVEEALPGSNDGGVTKREGGGWWKKRYQAAMTASGPKETAESWWKRNGVMVETAESRWMAEAL